MSPKRKGSLDSVLLMRSAMPPEKLMSPGTRSFDSGRPWLVYSTSWISSRSIRPIAMASWRAMTWVRLRNRVMSARSPTATAIP